MWRFAFVAVFFGLTLLPGLTMLTGVVPVRPIDENRTLAPAVTAETPIAAVPRIADRWFADHFGLRSLLIRLKTQIDFSLFGLSDRVLIGRDGQLFYRSTVNVEEPLMQETLETKASVALVGIERLAKALKAEGIGTVLTINMMADRYYPELLPNDAVRRPAHPRIDDFVADLKKLPDVLYVDSDPILRRIMPSRRIFPRTDFHWNDPAAFEVARAIVDRISAADGQPSPWTYPLKTGVNRTSGGIAMFMPLFKPPSERELTVEQTWSWPAGFTQRGREGLFEYATSAAPNPRLLPPTVFVGDSFMDGMLRSGLAANFIDMHRIRWAPEVKASTIVASLPPNTRWLVVEFIEVNQTALAAFADLNDVDAAVKILESRHAEDVPSR